LHLLDDGLGRRVKCKSLVCVLVVHVVSDAHELALLVAATEQDNCDADDLAVGNARQVWGVGAELELVDANRERADEDGIELLVILVSGAVGSAKICLGSQTAHLRGRRANVGQLPLEVCPCISGCYVVNKKRAHPSVAAPGTRT
jgi:hypothetical protein